MQILLKKTEEELILRNYSQKTIKSYLGCLREYFVYKKRDWQTLDNENIKAFLLKKQTGGYASQTINLYLNAIKFFYQRFLKSPVGIKIRYLKRSRKLPVVLSRGEVNQIISLPMEQV
jgi:site-specific recombinase XerD